MASPSEMTAAEFRALSARRGNKYRAVKTEVDGVTFDSKAEARRYGELKLRERAGEIHTLVLQPSFDLEVNGAKLGRYVADFGYMTADGEMTYEDVKGVRTPVYRLKKKLVEALYGVRIVEVAA